MVKLKLSLYRVTRETSIKRAKRQESIEPKHPAAYYYDDANFTQQTNIGLMSKICQDCQVGSSFIQIATQQRTLFTKM